MGILNIDDESKLRDDYTVRVRISCQLETLDGYDVFQRGCLVSMKLPSETKEQTRFRRNNIMLELYNIIEDWPTWMANEEGFKSMVSALLAIPYDVIEKREGYEVIDSRSTLPIFTIILEKK